jgi:predicted cupin superfamily sugar epimerase
MSFVVMDESIIRRWVDTLGLSPHPEGGFYRETYRAEMTLPESALSSVHGGPRSASTAIYFLVTAGSFSAFHRIASDELWHFHAGGALEIVTIDPSGARRDLHLGLDVERGERPQHVVTAGAWFGSRLRTDEDGYALVSCTVAPGFDFADFELARRDELARAYPTHVAIIAALTRE